MSTDNCNANTKTAVSYISTIHVRFNTPTKILLQWMAIMEKAREINAVNIKTFFDISVPDDPQKRRGFKAMRKFIQQNKVDYLIFTKTSLPSRKYPFVRKYFTDLENMGVMRVIAIDNKKPVSINDYELFIWENLDGLKKIP